MTTPPSADETSAPSSDRTAISPSTTNGAPAAAVVAAGIGSVALGLAIVLSDASATANQWFGFHEPVGPLGGKTIAATVVYVIAWLVLHFRWRDRAINTGRVLTITLCFMALALIMTFPPFYTLFHGTLP